MAIFFSFPLLQSIFEQVWAGEDFHLFKKIMVKKNLDLELQALHMIQQRNGIVPQVFASGKMLLNNEKIYIMNFFFSYIINNYCMSRMSKVHYKYIAWYNNVLCYLNVKLCIQSSVKKKFNFFSRKWKKFKKETQPSNKWRSFIERSHGAI